MTETTSSHGLRDLFDLCDRIVPLREILSQARHAAARRRLGREKERLRRRLLSGVGDEGPPAIMDTLHRLGHDDLLADLSAIERVLLLMLFHRRITEADYPITGRDLLWLFTDSGYELLETRRILEPGRVLVRSGLVATMADPEEDVGDPLGDLFALSSEVYAALGRRHVDPSEDDEITDPPYADNTDYLVDLDQLVKLYGVRAATLFELGIWREFHGESLEPVSAQTDRIEAMRAYIRRRLEATPDAAHFELVVFQGRHHLRPIEMIVVAALLGQEALLGNPALDCIDLLRLVSSSTRDLLRKRHLFDADAPLRRDAIIEFEDVQADKLVTGQCALANWVTEQVLDGNFRGGHAIRSEEKIEFHNYLSRLTGSDDFFEKLD